jgi:hypothetical protein
MKFRVAHVVAGLLVAGSAIAVHAQEPSHLLRIFREDIKSGKGAAHEKVEAAYVRAFARSGYPNYVAWEAMTGTSQAWFVERYDTYEAMEKAIKLAQSEPLKSQLDMLDEQDGALRSGERGIIATFQPGPSYQPVPANIAKGRYVSVNVLRIRPGHITEFNEMRGLLNAAYTKAGRKLRSVVYAVSSGMPAGTYLILSGMESLKAMDPAPGAMSIVDAFGADNLAKYTKLQSDIVVSSETTTFAVNPKMSNPPKEFIDVDQDFWAPKPKPMPAKPTTPAKQ